MSHRTQGKRTSTRDYEQMVISGPRCPCGKVRYLNKREAKKVIRRMRGRRSGRMHAYRCDGPNGDTTAWHVGHVPDDLRSGRATRDDVEARRFGS